MRYFCLPKMQQLTASNAISVNSAKNLNWRTEWPDGLSKTMSICAYGQTELECYKKRSHTAWIICANRELLTQMKETASTREHNLRGSFTVWLTSCLFFGIQLFCLCWISNRFTCSVKSKPVKQEVNRTVILPSMVSELCLDNQLYHFRAHIESKNAHVLLALGC